ncbi:hypothetical protein KY331_02800 [Candidatus Woesearchaeota archaeon]|nr:hypothetical protein [Candidatus Woesearchaeota archaeon]
MSEKRLVIDEIELNYSGLFDIHGFLKTIDTITKDRGYVKNEKERKEKITQTGKEIFYELRPVKRKTAFFVLMIKLRIAINNMKDVEVRRDQKKVMLHEGDIKILFDAWTTTDYEFRWEQKPIYYFLRNLIERVFYKVHTDRFLDELVDDAHFFHRNIKAYLNAHRF